MGILKETNEVKPLIFKLGIALALSFAGFLYTHFRFKVHPRRRPPSSDKSDIRRSSEGLRLSETETMISEPVETMHKLDPVIEPSVKCPTIDEDELLLPEFSELVLQGFSVSGISLLKEGSAEVDSDITKARDGGTAMESEIKELRNRILYLQEREKSLEMQLLEYYGLKEQENTVKDLGNHLKIKSMESKLLELKIESLQADNRRLQEQVMNYSTTTEELESARANIIWLKKQIRTENELAKKQLTALQERVSTLQALENESCSRDKEIQKKLQCLHDLENETALLRDINARLRQENLELARKLELSETAASTTNSAHEAEVEVSALEQVDTLRESNKRLMEDFERLHTDRCADVEELVYLRWINACLRYELRSFQASPGKTVARDLSKSLSPRSEEKAKKLILEYAGSGRDAKGLPDFDLEFYSSSQTSTLTDAEEFDDSSLEVQSATRSSSSKKNLFNKLKGLMLGKRSPERETSVSRNSGNFSNSERLSVSKSLPDELTSAHSHESFTPSINAELDSLAKLSDFRSKSLRVDSLMMDRITKKNSQLNDPGRVSSSLSDISRRIHLRTGGTRERKAAEQENFITTDWESEIMDDDHANDYRLDGEMGVLSSLREENDKLHESQSGSEKLELLKFAEVLKSSRRLSKGQRKPASSSF